MLKIPFSNIVEIFLNFFIKNLKFNYLDMNIIFKTNGLKYSKKKKDIDHKYSN